MKVFDVIKETVSVGTVMMAQKDGKTLPIIFDTLPHPVQYRHINQELKRKIPSMPEIDRINLSRELAAKKVAKYKNVEFVIQDKKPREMWETSAAGGMSAGAVATVPANSKKKPKMQNPTNNALDMKNVSLFGGSLVKR
jgi:hypothetical protein